MKMKRTIITICISVLFGFMLVACKKQIKTEDEIAKDAIERDKSFISYDLFVDSFQVIKRNTDENGGTDNIIIGVNASNDDFTYYGEYSLQYVLYDNGWLIDNFNIDNSSYFAKHPEDVTEADAEKILKERNYERWDLIKRDDSTLNHVIFTYNAYIPSSKDPTLNDLHIVTIDFNFSMYTKWEHFSVKIKEANPEEINKSQTNNSVEITELMDLYGKNIAEALITFPYMEHEEYEGVTTYTENKEKSIDNLSLAGPIFDVGTDDTITSITYGGEKYNLLGIHAGEDFKDASEIVKKKGWQFSYGSFAHGTATYYAVYTKDDLELYISTNGEGDFRILEEKDIEGIVNQITICKPEDDSDDKTSDITDVFDYKYNYKDLVDKQNMIPFGMWLGIGDTYESYQFMLEYDEYGEFSMKNEGSPYVSICGIMIGDRIDSVPEKMNTRGLRKFYETDEYLEYYMKEKEKLYDVIIYKENENVKSWYFCNWPEGEDALEMWDAWE